MSPAWVGGTTFSSATGKQHYVTSLGGEKHIQFCHWQTPLQPGGKNNNIQFCHWQTPLMSPVLGEKTTTPQTKRDTTHTALSLLEKTPLMSPACENKKHRHSITSHTALSLLTQVRRHNLKSLVHVLLFVEVRFSRSFEGTGQDPRIQGELNSYLCVCLPKSKTEDSDSMRVSWIHAFSNDGYLQIFVSRCEMHVCVSSGTTTRSTAGY